MTNEQKARLLKEFLDNPKVAVLTCSKHMYSPGGIGIEKTALAAPMYGTESSKCADCWWAYWVALFALMPEEERMSRLDDFLTTAHHAVEAEKRGETVIELFRHPKIEITKEEDPVFIN